MRRVLSISFLFCTLLLSVLSAPAQQTTVFTYQGRLSDHSIPATSTYPMTFEIYNVPTFGSALDSQTSSVLVTNGIFTVDLDFDAAVFNGQNLFLRIIINGTPLLPRLPINSVPYAVRSEAAASADALSVFCSSCVTDAMVSNTLTASDLAAAGSVVSNAEVDDNLTISGGTIDGTPIGATTQSTGNFTIVTTGVGTAAAPGYSFVGDTNTGIFRGATAETLNFSTNGASRMSVTETNVTTLVPLTIGNSGTEIGSSPRISVVVPGATNLGANSCMDFGGSATAVVAGAEVFVGAPSDPPQGIVWNGYVPSATSVSLRLCNVTPGSIIVPVSTWNLRVFNP